MSVNFSKNVIFNVHLTNFTFFKNSNISSKTLYSILNQIKNVDNIPKSVEKALFKKSEKHPDIAQKLSLAYHKRVDKIHTTGIEKQNEILKDETTDTDKSEDKLYKLSHKMFSISPNAFRYNVLLSFKKGFDHSTPLKTNAALHKARKDLSTATKMFPQKIHPQNRHNREKITNKINKLTDNVSKLEKQYIEDKYTLTKAIIYTAETNPHLLSKEMIPFLKEIKKEINKYLVTPHIRAQVKENIKTLTALKEENKQQMDAVDCLISLTTANDVIRDTNKVLKKLYNNNEGLKKKLQEGWSNKIESIITTENQKREAIADKTSSHPETSEKKRAVKDSEENTTVQDEMTKLPDVPTHKPNLTRKNWVMIKPTEG